MVHSTIPSQEAAFEAHSFESCVFVPRDEGGYSGFSDLTFTKDM